MDKIFLFHIKPKAKVTASH